MVSRQSLLRHGWEDAVELHGLDVPLPEFVAGAADAATFDRPEDAGLVHTDGRGGLCKGVAHRAASRCVQMVCNDAPGRLTVD